MPRNEQIDNDRLSAEASVNLKKHGFGDYAALAFSTCGVGYIPIAPGTFGSLVGLLMYLALASVESKIGFDLANRGWRLDQISASFLGLNLVLLLLICVFGIWASERASKLLKNKDPQKIVIDEVMGQLVVFLFIPFGVHWSYLFAGFLLFRFFDIWKPYPIDLLQDIPHGIGVCADDLVAGVYGGISLSVIYAVAFNF